MARINLTDTIVDGLVKMAEGNPGAINAMMSVITHGDEIDPQSALGSFGTILSLDTHEIYGTDIYVLFNDQCNSNVRCFLMLLRAVQLGFFSEDRLQSIAGDQTRSNLLSEEELNVLDEKVCGRLQDFQKKPAEEDTA